MEGSMELMTQEPRERRGGSFARGLEEWERPLRTEKEKEEMRERGAVRGRRAVRKPGVFLGGGPPEEERPGEASKEGLERWERPFREKE